MRFFTVLMFILLAFVGPAGAETGGATDTKKEIKSHLYEWTDTKGNVHITDDLGEVPEPYRAKARTIEMPKSQETGAQQQGAGKYTPGAAGETQDAAKKAGWQRRLREWKARLANAEQRYHALEQKRLDALGQWGGSAASGHLEGRAEADRIAQDMKAVQKEIDDAKNMIENVIPEEARKAGIPPGWLRE